MRRTRKKAFVVTKFKPKLVIVPPKKFLGKRIIGVLFLVLGSAILTGSFFYFFLIPNYFKPDRSVKEVKKETDFPRRLVIPVLSLDLPVAEARIIDGQWGLPANAAVFLPDNNFFAQKSGTLFGSNQTGVLNNLGKVKKGDRIYLFGRENFLLFSVEEIVSSLPGEPNSNEKLPVPEGTLVLFSTGDYLKGKRIIVKAGIIL